MANSRAAIACDCMAQSTVSACKAYMVFRRWHLTVSSEGGCMPSKACSRLLDVVYIVCPGSSSDNFAFCVVGEILRVLCARAQAAHTIAIKADDLESMHMSVAVSMLSGRPSRSKVRDRRISMSSSSRNGYAMWKLSKYCR